MHCIRAIQRYRSSRESRVTGFCAHGFALSCTRFAVVAVELYWCMIITYDLYLNQSITDSKSRIVLCIRTERRCGLSFVHNILNRNCSLLPKGCSTIQVQLLGSPNVQRSAPGQIGVDFTVSQFAKCQARLLRDSSKQLDVPLHNDGILQTRSFDRLALV